VAGIKRARQSKPEDLVLLHGFGGTRHAWDGVVAHLQTQRYRPLALDLPGHGELADAPWPITFDDCVESVLERSPPRFALAGYSMGGRIALHVALAAAQRVRRLALVAASPGIESPAERAARRGADQRLAEEIEAGTIEQFIARWCAQPLFEHDPPAVDALAAADYARNHPAALAAVLRGVGAGEMDPLWGRLGELAMPVTVLAGERDAKYRQVAARIVELVPDGRIVVIAGGHRLPLESPAALAPALTARR
jgi:2-succinyl-6-hydroxy-2,4-cyclohexadiene-1-carboxylate synthase